MHAIKFLVIAAVFLVSGCATTTANNRVTTQKVLVPVSAVCESDTPTPPEFCFPNLLPTEPLSKKVVCLLSDRNRHIAYEIELTAALKSCK